MSKPSEKTILVVGQTPPPVHGQAVMIEQMLGGHYGDVRLHHVRMTFSRRLEEVSRFRLYKVAALVGVLFRILAARFRTGADVLWYPPAGARLAPVLRDLVLLPLIRPFFRKTIFYFHAGGVGEMYDRLPRALRPLYRAAYYYPDVAIRVSEHAPEDGKALRARREYVVPNGVPDPSPRQARPAQAAPVMLFVGALTPDKGVTTLLEACRLLAERGTAFQARLVGGFVDDAYEAACRGFVRTHGLEDRVSFAGILVGAAKHAAFDEAALLCHPSRFETFGLVLVEALSHGLPVVATRTGGIPSIVQDGRCGYLVPVDDAEALADRLGTLLRNSSRRRVMGREARHRYLRHYTVQAYRRRLRAVFDAVTGPTPADPLSLSR